MAGYIGSKSSVTQVDGYTEAEADAEFVTKTGDTMSGNLDVTGTVTSDGLTSTGSGANTTYFTGGDNSVAGRQLTLSSEASGGQNNATHRLSVPSGYGSFAVSVNSAERMRIDTSGNVGIGTSSPSDKFHVDGAGAFVRVNRTDGEAGITLMYNGSNSTRSNIATQTNGDLAIDTANTERMRIDTSGRVTMPYQPAFNVRLNTSNSTAPSGIDTVKFNQIVTNVGSHYSNSTGRFTAPVSGFYQINLSMYFQNGTNYVGSMLQSGDGTIYYNFSSVGPDVFVYTSQAVYLNQNDFLFTRTYCGGSTTLLRQYSYFSGYLIG